MAKKQTIAKEVKETVAAASRRVAKPKAPRVTAATHSKTAIPETVIEPAAHAAETIVPVAGSAPVTTASENPHDEIARLAYSYWEARGYQGGCPAEDWLRAESEYRRKAAAAGQ